MDGPGKAANAGGVAVSGLEMSIAGFVKVADAMLAFGVVQQKAGVHLAGDRVTPSGPTVQAGRAGSQLPCGIAARR